MAILSPRRILFAIAMSALICAVSIIYVESKNMVPDPNCYPCSIIGTQQSNIAQAILLPVGLCSLVVAWRLESNRRTWQHMAADNLKQGISAMVVHFLATVIAMELRHITSWVDECDWYLMVFVWDTVLGCALNIVFYRWSAALFACYPPLEPLSRIGDYEYPPDENGDRKPSTLSQRTMRWVAQVLHWVLCAILGRLCVFLLFFILHNPFGHVATLLGAWACSEERVQTKIWLFVVLIPVTMDATQFVIQNYFLKPKVEQGAAAENPQSEWRMKRIEGDHSPLIEEDIDHVDIVEENGNADEDTHFESEA